MLADEINRTPPKTQAALLEAMQERQVTVGRVRHPLTDPFFVLATQNPIEQEGTYPLPEAQQDRFMFKVFVNYPNFQRGVRGRPPHDGHSDRQRSGGAERAGNHRTAANRARSAGQRPHHSLCAVAGAADARRPDGRARLRQRPDRLGRRPAGRAVLDSRRQGAGPASRPHARHDRRHSGPGQARAAAPPGREFRRPKRRRHAPTRSSTA